MSTRRPLSHVTRAISNNQSCPYTNLQSCYTYCRQTARRAPEEILLNRLEGSGELPPPTPPGMRVRTGRFRRSRGRGTVVKVNPRLPHVGHTLLPQPLLVQGPLDATVTRHALVPLAAPRGPCDLVTRDPQGQQMASGRARPLPLCPG